MTDVSAALARFSFKFESAWVVDSSEPRVVFVSHSGEDTWAARQIAAKIEAAGAHAFLDEAYIDAGVDFEEEILEFLEKAHEPSSSGNPMVT